MHNKYITTCCILDKREKLLLLKYTDVDITNISPILQEMTTSLMDQCYRQVEAFHYNNKGKNKKYQKIASLVVEQMKDMLFIKRKFIEYFLQPGTKTKEDLLTYVFAYKISIRNFNEYLYWAMVESLKQDCSPEFWDKHQLDMFEVGTLGFSDYRLFEDTKDECSVGPIRVDYKPAIKAIDDYTSKHTIDDKLTSKLNIIRTVGTTLDNYYNVDFPSLHNPYKDSIMELVDNIKVSIDMDQPKQLIKRI